MEGRTIDEILSGLLAEPGKQIADSERKVIIETQAMISALGAVLIRARLTNEKELCDIRDACRRDIIQQFKEAEAKNVGYIPMDRFAPPQM